MKYNTKKIFCYLFLQIIYCGVYTHAQIGSSINTSRKADWENTGYQRSPDNNLPSGNSTVWVAYPTSNTSTNLASINNAINSASSSSHAGNRVVVQFRSGIYSISQPITLDSNNEHIILRGYGNLQTKIKYEGNSSSRSDIIKIEGTRSGTEYDIANYNSSQKKITLSSGTSSLQTGDLVDIRVEDNVAWLDFSLNDSWREDDFFGQVVRVSERISSTQFKLEDDIGTVWDLADQENERIFLSEIYPTEEIGIENLVIEPDPVSNSSDEGTNILFKYAYNCWVKNIESNYTHSDHIRLHASSNIEVRDNYIHNSYNYGGGGHGYGVYMIYRTTNSLVENNILQSLRHAMIVQLSANRNVYGFNYSRDQKDEIDNVLGDINLHGFYPFANLFEGNRIDRIYADETWGPNGPNNTFFRNFVTSAEFLIKASDQTNALGNESSFVIHNSNDILSKYSINLSQHKWNPAREYNTYLIDKSYYHTNKPTFLSSSYSWPPLGPPTSSSLNITTQNIPARQSYCNSNSCYGTRHSTWYKTDDLVVFRSDGGTPETLNLLAFVNSTGSSLTGFGEDDHGADDIIDLASAEFNGDGVEDLVIAKDNKIYLRTSIGSDFQAMLNFQNNYGSNISLVTAGDYNGDGLADIAYVTEGIHSGIHSRIVVYVSDSNIGNNRLNHTMSFLTYFDMGGYDFKGITSGDFDGDGKDDIAFFRKGSSSAINWILAYKLNGTSFSKIIDFEMGGYDFKGITSGDFDADGKDDISIYRRVGDQDPTENWIIAYKRNGMSLSLINDFTYGTYDIKGITSGDYNADGIDDIGIYRRGGYSDPIEHKIITFKSTTSGFSFYKSFQYGGYDFKGITSGRFFYGGTGQAFKAVRTDNNIEEETEEKPTAFQLQQNYPNPFNPVTNIQYSTPVDTYIKLEVFDQLGRSIAILVNEHKETGTYNVSFDASNLSSGVYFYVLIADDFLKTNKMLLVK